MKVLVILNSLELGGTQINAIDQVASLAEEGVESIVVGYRSPSIESGPSLLDVASDRGVTIELMSPLDRTVNTAPRLAAVANRHDVDLVHAYSATQVRNAFWGPCLLGGRPLVMTVYEMSVPPHVPRHQHLIVGTKYLDEEQRASRPGPVHFISPPVDTNHDDPAVSPTEFEIAHGLEDRKLRIFIVSRLDELMKATAIDHAFSAIERLGRTDLQLVVVGGGTAQARLAARAREVNGRLGWPSIVMTGPQSDPREAYASADIVIGMGGSAARALAFGKPLVVSGEAGWYRLFTPETSDSLYRQSFWSAESELEPVDSLCRELRAIVDRPELRHELGEYGRQFALDHFSLSAMSRKLFEVYREAIKSHRRIDWVLDVAAEAKPAIRYLVRTVDPRR